MNRPTIADILRTARSDLQLSQRDVAVRAGVVQRTVSNIEAGHGLTLDTVQRVADALGLELTLIPREERP